MADEATRLMITEAFDAWSRGDQNAAIERVRPAADAGDAIGLGLISWFIHQLGEPRWREGIPYAEGALAKGMPWVAAYYFGNMVNDATLRQRTPAFIRPALDAGWWQIDALAHALAPFQQGDRGTAVNLVEVAAEPRLLPPGWEEFAKQARQFLDELREAAGSVSDRKNSALAAMDSDAARSSNCAPGWRLERINSRHSSIRLRTPRRRASSTAKPPNTRLRGGHCGGGALAFWPLPLA